MVQCSGMEMVVAEGRVAPGGAGRGGGARTEPEGLPCPRCESTNTKFCYYNNYNLAQPRHFCKGCRRYWTRGGALRNVPVGGGTRKATPALRRKRAPPQGAPALAAVPGQLAVTAPPLALPFLPSSSASYELPFLPAPMTVMEPERRLLDLGGSFSTLLAHAHGHNPDGHYTTGFFLRGAAPPPAPAPAPAPVPALPQPPHPHMTMSQAMPESFWGMGWPHLSI